MQKININLENCFGIKKLEKELDFCSSNINTIYARNGLMKTSLTKVFKKIQDDKKGEIGDVIFESTPTICDIKVDGNDILKEEIFVIQTFENSYESDSIASLLINTDLKQKLSEVIQLKDKYFKVIEKMSGIKVIKTLGGKIIYDLEPTIIEDFGLSEKSFLLNINTFNFDDIEYDFSNICYSIIFNDSALKKIKLESFQSKIRDFISRSYEIYENFHFLDKGKFTLPKLKEIKKGLEKNVFFVKDNKLVLAGSTSIGSLSELNNMIKEIESQLQGSSEFKELEKLLSDAAGRELRDLIENNPEIVEELQLFNLENFRKKLWLSYIKKETTKFEELKMKYQELEQAIEQENIDATPWKEALDIFNSRFAVPFNMEISNLKSSIIGESVPKVIFSFCKDGNKENLDVNNWVKLNRDELENKNTLSQGERRALYLLNIIFDIEKRKRINQKTLFIIDDIADSFDYKNKYAIVEYLKEISEHNNFYMLILSHNFDFYRTISSRLNMGRKNRHMAMRDTTGIIIEQEYYQKQPFEKWMECLNKKNVIALIPFVRNLVDFGFDKKVTSYTGISSDYLFLTNLLHIKSETRNLTMADLKKVYKAYIDKDNFLDNITDTEYIYEAIIDIAGGVSDNDTRLENKIILSLAIRLYAEEFMINQISESTETFNWFENRSAKSGQGAEFLCFINNNTNQTRELYKGYCQNGNADAIKILDKVNIMTPESIHLNSFMYEPILDMDINELKNLYNNIVSLSA
jgi:ABC-type phosphate/phosphonate transport system ATPase subunit